MTKSELLNKLYEEYRNKYCEEEFVPGYGNINTNILLIGEAPGREEVKLGKPFVGAAGKNLETFLRKLEFAREDIYTTNAIKYRLSTISEKTGRKINRPATVKEIEEAIITLKSEIEIIEPSYIITLGNVPLKTLTYEFYRPIGEVHGECLSINLSGKQIKLIPLYHPASLIYNRSLEVTYNADVEKLKMHLKYEK